MTGLYIFLGIIFFFALLFSVPVFVNFEYTDAVRLSIQWLFVKIKIYPNDKPKKEKKKKEPKPKEEPKKEEEKKEEEKPAKPAKENFMVTFYNNQGVGGIIELVRNCASVLGKFSKGFLKSIYITKLRIGISVSESDAAKTAIKYGKICSELYPALGYICSSCHVKNYKVNVVADYIGDKTVGEIETKVGFVPRSIFNAGIAMVFRLAGQLLKVVFTNIKSANQNTANTNSNKKGGQKQ